MSRGLVLVCVRGWALGGEVLGARGVSILRSKRKVLRFGRESGTEGIYWKPLTVVVLVEAGWSVEGLREEC